MKNISDKDCRETRNTHCMANNMFSKVVPIMRSCARREGQATDENTVHAHRMLDTQGYKHTQTSCVILIAFPPQKKNGCKNGPQSYVTCTLNVLFLFKEFTMKDVIILSLELMKPQGIVV